MWIFVYNFIIINFRGFIIKNCNSRSDFFRSVIIFYYCSNYLLAKIYVFKNWRWINNTITEFIVRFLEFLSDKFRVSPKAIVLFFALVSIEKLFFFEPEVSPQFNKKTDNKVIIKSLIDDMRTVIFWASYLIKFSLKNHCTTIKRLYLCTRQVLHNQLLLNPPGRERSKGKWS